MSYRYNDPVIDLIAERLPVSIYYGLVTTLLTYLICIPLGVLKAVKDKTWTDTITSVLIFAGYSVPSFVLGLILLVYLAGDLDWFPMSGFVGDDFEELGFFGKIGNVIHTRCFP